MLYFTAVVGVVSLIGGLFIMRFALKKLLWNRLQALAGTLTLTPVHGMLAGTAAAALMQSSTAVSLITIGLVSAEYISFYQGLGIILGANIGTCSTVQLLSVTLPGSYLPALMLVTLTTVAVSKKFRCPALACLGLLCMFTGIEILSQTAGKLARQSNVISCLAMAESNPLYGIAGGILITFLTQSSSAATALLMSLADGGMVDLKTATYVVYGNNIGSCLSSAVVASLAPLPARRVAVSHILLNILGTAIALPLTGKLAALAAAVSSDFSAQVAWVHTIFNVASSLIVLPVVRQYANLVIYLTPGRR